MISGRNQTGSGIMDQMKEFQSCLELFKEDRLFDILRIYLGEIKTPFNKQRLLEQLSGFFLNQENRKNILALVSKEDLKLITAVCLIKNATNKRIEDFFTGEIPVSEICDKINNLIERLIFLYKKSETDDSKVLVINPLLRNLFEPFVSSSVLMPEVTYSVRFDEASFAISPQFLAAVLSYVNQFPELCKNDGSIKKKDMERLESIFLGNVKLVSRVFKSFLNLGILKQGTDKVSIDSGKLNEFSKLNSLSQYVYLCVAGAGILSRESLRVQSQILMDTIASLPKEGALRRSILQIAFLIGNKQNRGEGEPFARRRFSMIVEKSRMTAETSSDSQVSGIGQQTKDHMLEIMDRIIDFALEAGIFSCAGKDQNGEEIYVRGPACDLIEFPPEGMRKVLNIDAGTNITVLPGLELKDFVKLIPFMQVTALSTVGQFEISRKSVCSAFDQGYKIEDIFAHLNEYTAYEIPKSLKINIEDWSRSYSSAMLFKGYVLKIDEKNVSLAENNPKISPFIQLKLAEGVYLLNLPVDQSADDFLNNCGLDFIGSVKTAKQESSALGFPLLNGGKDYFEKRTGTALFSEEKQLPLEEEGLRICKEMSEKLENAELTDQQKECLRYRIKRGIIVNSSQLNPGTVRFEILEASGMDYAGKIHLINNAISSGNMIEISVISETDSGKIEKFFGLPQLLTRAEESAVVRITIEPEKDIRVFSVGRISHVKMIRRYI